MVKKEHIAKLINGKTVAIRGEAIRGEAIESKNQNNVFCQESKRAHLNDLIISMTKQYIYKYRCRN